MEFKIYPTNISITRCITFPRKKCWSELLVLQILIVLVFLDISQAKYGNEELQLQRMEKFGEKIQSHSCIHDEIIEQRKKRPGHKVFSVTQQVYHVSSDLHHKGRELLGISKSSSFLKNRKLPIRIYLNYDAVGHSHDRDCRNVGDIVKLGEPPVSSNVGQPSCNPHNDPPITGDCWYNCTLDDITGHDKRHRLQKALEQTAEWFKRALAVERVRGNLRLSGYSACGQDGGVQLPREYVEKGVADADLVLLVTTRPTTGNTLAWAVACERDQWGRAIAGHVNVAPRHLTAEAETLLSATLIHEVIHVLGFDPHAFTHFRDERKRRRSQVTKQSVDEKLGRMVTRVVLPRVIMHSRHHYGAFSENFTGLELEDGGGRGTSGSHWEKRLLMNEIMTGSVDTRSVVSKMTLALLEDSGWYEANYSMADRLDWGHKQGTEFVTAPCNLWKGAYHCNTTQFSGCTYNREAEGYCPIVNYSGDLPQWARYFPQPNKGGQSSLADYCTYFVAYSDGSCIDTNSARMPDRMLGEVRGSSSRCMASSLVRNGFVRGSMAQGNGCYRHRCINMTLEVAVDGIWKACPEAGGPIQFPGFNGELICPAHHELCNVNPLLVSKQCPNSCNSNGDCVDGKCLCFLGFDGHDCSKRSCPSNCNGNGKCLKNGICQCADGFTGVDCSTAVCDEQCSLHGGVCDNGVCEFRCSDYAGYTCRNTSLVLENLSICKNVLMNDVSGQHCAPSESSILRQLEDVVVMPNYHRLYPTGARKILNMFIGRNCDKAAKRLACWISIQKCEKDGNNRLRVCYSACEAYNLACGASLDCSDQTLFSDQGLCTGELICPAHHELCNVNPLLVSKQCPNSCNSNGDCVDGKCLCFLGFDGHDCSKRSCPSNCNGNGKCLNNGICQCADGFTGVDCSTAVCDEQCSLHGGVCDNGVCEFRCSDYAGYTCRNTSLVLENLSICKNVLMNDVSGQHCAPSESSILRQLEDVVVMPNYHRLYPTGARKILNMFIGRNCDKAAKRLACWISIQKCEKDGNNRLRVCYSACEAYNLACGASLDCSDQTLFSDQGLCTGSGDMESWF